jgi:hypothetical protein
MGGGSYLFVSACDGRVARPRALGNSFFGEMKEKDWVRLKPYPHIGPKLGVNDIPWVRRYVKDVKKVEEHSFLPFIHRTMSVRKFRREKHPNGDRSKLRVASPPKKREIFYANHLDANLYAYYAFLLSKAYNTQLIKLEIDQCVTAYRRIPLNEKRNKCNIDFAKEIFDHIEDNCGEELAVITFDITRFFDNLNHKRLKKAWKAVLEVDDLPPDHYNIFKNITRFSYVEIDVLFEEFKDEMNLKKLHYLAQKDVKQFCTLEQFKSKVRTSGMIHTNKWEQPVDEESGRDLVRRTRGIPQGSPISAVLANLYLLDFDKLVNDAAVEAKGLYRRYSDDMVVVCKMKDRDFFIELLEQEIRNFDLDIQPAKTQVFRFKTENEEISSNEWNRTTGQYQDNTKFEYLGFFYDGKAIGLKSAGLSSYYRKMKRSVRRHAFFQRNGKYETGKFFRNKVIKQFTHLGKRRRLIWKRKKGSTNKYVKSKKFNWGNYLTYAELAHNAMGDKSIIKRQLRRHWNKVQEEITMAQKSKSNVE